MRMSENTLRKYSVAWLGGIPIAILNGFARNFLYGPYMSELRAHQVLTVTGVIFIFGYYWVLNSRWPIESMRQAQTIGVIWILFTVVFEFLFGHYVMGNTWGRLLQDYNLMEGRVWIVFILNLLASPIIILQIEGGKTESRN